MHSLGVDDYFKCTKLDSKKVFTKRKKEENRQCEFTLFEMWIHCVTFESVWPVAFAPTLKVVADIDIGTQFASLLLNWLFLCRFQLFHWQWRRRQWAFKRVLRMFLALGGQIRLEEILNCPIVHVCCVLLVLILIFARSPSREIYLSVCVWGDRSTDENSAITSAILPEDPELSISFKLQHDYIIALWWLILGDLVRVPKNSGHWQNGQKNLVFWT